MISKIEKDFYQITLRMPYRLRHVNAYLFIYEGKLALFDTGLNTPQAFETLGNDLSGIGFGIEDIQHIYLTHVHSDHCSMAGVLQKRSGAQIHLAQAAFEEYRHFREAGPTIKQLRIYYARQGMSQEQIGLVIEEYENIRGIIADFDAADFLRDKDVREFGNWKIEIISTPGHAAGHVCFFCREMKFLLSGDHVLPYIAPVLSPDIFDEAFRPLAAYLDSLNALKNLCVTAVYPGHGISFVDLQERIADIREHHSKRKTMVLDRVHAQPRTARDISHETLAPTLSDFDKFLALNEMIAYLKELTAEGAIKEDTVNDVLVYVRPSGY
ncbi:MAG TPA: MBL fold metallo-hydrolase [Smithella sp.]|nr:MBL fold metallo-hydrolase [Smithella sp.]